ncbi:MAG: hypothetical protein QM727_02705 [Niabella sp.]
MTVPKSIPCFVINIKSRTERRAQVLKEFSSRGEFDVNVVNAIQNEVGAISLWETICSVIKRGAGSSLDFILICEDDHQFTNDYEAESFFKGIGEAMKNGADILLGGVSWFTDVLFLTDSLIKVKRFTGTQFVVIESYKVFKIL